MCIGMQRVCSFPPPDECFVGKKAPEGPNQKYSDCLYLFLMNLPGMEYKTEGGD